MTASARLILLHTPTKQEQPRMSMETVDAMDHKTEASDEKGAPDFVGRASESRSHEETISTGLNATGSKKHHGLLPLAVATLIILAIFIPLLLHFFGPYSTGKKRLVPADRSSACDVQYWFENYTAESIDELLGIDRFHVSDLTMSMSEDGSVLAVSALEWRNNVRIVHNLGSAHPTVSFVRATRLDKIITSMALSGNGKYLLAAGEQSLILMEIATRTSIPIPDVLGEANSTVNFQISDVVINENGTIFAVALGTHDMSSASFDLGDERGYWEWNNNMTVATTVVFERKDWRGSQGDWELVEFPTMFQPDGFGHGLAMTSSGNFLVRSSERDNRNHQVNPIYRINPMGAWATQLDTLVLNRNEECKAFSSDVAVTEDGELLVIVIQCLLENRWNEVRIVRFLKNANQTDTDEPVYNTTLTPKGVGIDRTFFGRMSVSLAGNGDLIIISIDGFGLIKTNANDVETSVDILGLGNDSIFSTKVSGNGTTFAFATASSTEGGSICLFKKV